MSTDPNPLLRRLAECHRAALEHFVPWHVGDEAVGWVHRERQERLAAGFACQPERLVLPGAAAEQRSARVATFVAALAATGEVRTPTGEYYPVRSPRDGTLLLQVDRCAVPWLGVPSEGVHLNGFRRADGELHLWLAVRARGKATFPGCLDNLVAGGQSLGYDAATTLAKECGEEAAIPPELANAARYVARHAYRQQDGLALKVDTLHCFDLELPTAFVPTPNDGEVESFRCWPVAEVLASLAGDDAWKPNSALVTIDFLLRMGVFDPWPAAAQAALRAALRGPSATG